MGPGAVQKGCRVRAACEGFPGGWGNFPGLCSLSLNLLLYVIYRFVQCKMQKLPRKQKAMLPPATPPEVFANPISSFTMCFCQRLLALFIHFAAQYHGFNRRGG